jgi:RTX calcium-binding nonapeptide repeat (4 copies)
MHDTVDRAEAGRWVGVIRVRRMLLVVAGVLVLVGAGTASSSIASPQDAAAFGGSVHFHHDENPALSGDQGPTRCEDANRKQNATLVAGQVHQVIGCIFDQFGDPDGDGNADPASLLDNIDSTMEISGVGTFVSCEGVISSGGKSCHFDDLDSASEVADKKYEAEWRSTETGSIIITFCVDLEANGCADATAADSIYDGPPSRHVHLVSSADPSSGGDCHGASTLTADVRSSIALTGCAFGEAHSPAAGARLLWRVTTSGLANRPGGYEPVRFVGGPDLIADGNGRAVAMVTANPLASGHESTVTFCWDTNDDAQCDSPNALTATFHISWGGPGCVRGTGRDDEMDGSPTDDCLKGAGGDDHVAGAGGRDILFGGAGSDFLRGGPGADTLVGGSGRDTCFGGVGDTFVSCERKP